MGEAPLRLRLLERAGKHEEPERGATLRLMVREHDVGQPVGKRPISCGGIGAQVALSLGEGGRRPQGDGEGEEHPEHGNLEDTAHGETRIVVARRARTRAKKRPPETCCGIGGPFRCVYRGSPHRRPTMIWIYRLLFPFVLLATAPYYLWRMRRRGGYGAGFRQRFGLLAPLAARRPGARGLGGRGWGGGGGPGGRRSGGPPAPEASRSC